MIHLWHYQTTKISISVIAKSCYFSFYISIDKVKASDLMF